MAAVKALVRKLFPSREAAGADDRNLRLRKAVQHARPRQVAALLDEGASPVWMPSPLTLSRRGRVRRAGQLNALLLACQFGDVAVLGLLMDALFDQPEVLQHFARAMYSLVIRHGHWRAFLLLRQRRILIGDAECFDQGVASDRSDEPAQDSTDYRSGNTGDLAGILFGSCANLLSTNPYALKLPLPVFVAAEYGRHEMLEVLIRDDARSWREYSFKGHTLLTIATRGGHYECVELLLSHIALSREALDTAIACAKRYRQAHVLVLLTSCLPEFHVADNEPFSNKMSRHGDDMPLASHHGRYGTRGSLAETVMSDGEGDAGDVGEFQRSSMVMWLMDDHDSADSLQRHMGQGDQERDVVAIMRSARVHSHDRRADREKERRKPISHRHLDLVDRENRVAHGWSVSPVGLPSSSSFRSNSGHSEEGIESDHGGNYAAYKPFRDDDHSGESSTDESDGSPRSEAPVSAASSLTKSPPAAPQSTPSSSSLPRKIISIRSHSMKMRRSLPSIEENESGEADA